MAYDNTYFTMTSPSMEGTIKEGSKLVVNRKDEVKRNDIVVFWVPPSRGNFFVFRAVAMPGDTLVISKGMVSVNGISQQPPKTLQYRYFIETSEPVSDDFFGENGIKVFRQRPEGYVMLTTEEKAERIKHAPFIKSIERVTDEPEYEDSYLFADFLDWNADNLGPIYLPKRGDKMQGDDLKRYIQTIQDHEGVDVTNSNEYEFTKNYCFVMGDNCYDALDSRYIGPVPMDKVLGPVKTIIEPK